jgi:hypothetical protein
VEVTNNLGIQPDDGGDEIAIFHLQEEDEVMVVKN